MTSIEKSQQESNIESRLKGMDLPQDQIEDILKAISETTDKLKTQNIELQNLEIQDNLSNLKDNITGENADTRTSISIKMKDKDGKNIGTIDYNVKIRESKVSLNQQNSPSSQIDQNQTPASQPTNQPETSSTTQSDTKPETQPETNTQIDNKIDIYSVNGFMTTLNMLLREIEDTRVGISKKGLSKAGKKTMDAATKKLNQYEKRIKAKKDALEKQIALGASPQINEIDINYVRQLQSDIDTVRQKDVKLGQRGELSNTAPFLYNSPENARSANRSQESINNFERNLKNEVKDGAILNIFGRQEQAAIDFYRRIAEGRYTQADYNVYKTNENIFNPSFQRCGIATPILVPTYVAGTNPEIGAQTINQVKPQVDYSNMDRGETFQQGGIAGIIDKGLSNCKNMTPGQRETWKSLAVLGGFAAGIYGLFKFYTGKGSFRKKAGITAAVIFGSQALTGEGPLSLYKKFMTGGLSKNEMEAKFGAFGDAVNGVGNSGIEAANTIAPAMYSMMIFNPSMTVGELNTQTRLFKENPEAWKTFRQEAISKLKNKYGDNSIQHFSATFTDDFDEEKWNARLASFGVTDSTVTTTKIYELANNASMNEIILEKFKENHGLKVNPKKKDELNKYMSNLKNSNQAINIAILESHINNNDRFITDNEATFSDRSEDKENKKALNNQVEGLPLDSHKKNDLKTALESFYDERTIASKPNPNDFDLKIENGKLVLTSHGGYEAEIDLDKKELIGFGSGISFTNLSDLLNVADLSNKILETQKGQSPAGNPIFEYKLERKGICFNSANSIRKDIITRNNSGMDTRVLSTGRGGATSKIEQLCDKPKEFAEYLSKRRLEENQQRLAS